MKTVFVGMSGGVDSSVAAAVLKNQGFKVVGAYMKNWTQDLPGFDCPWQDDFRDAQRVAVKLGIELEVFDFEQEYRAKVVDYMIDEYKSGRTPNPDIMCNQEVKFKLFLETATQNGADLIATGHYARTAAGQLLTAHDETKDQTYFLYRVSQSALEKTLFPIGDFNNKHAVRVKATELNLPTAEKKDSQGICFVGKVGIKEFLQQFVETEPGPIVNSAGTTIGEHEGAIFYTVGQRHGLNVGGGLPYYVFKKDMKTNTVYVTTDLSDAQLWSERFIIRSNNWINEQPSEKVKYRVRMRHRGPKISCTIQKRDGSYELMLRDEQRALSPGQSAVLYLEDKVIGGGLVSEVFHK